MTVYALIIRDVSVHNIIYLSYSFIFVSILVNGFNFPGSMMLEVALIPKAPMNTSILNSVILWFISCHGNQDKTIYLRLPVIV